MEELESAAGRGQFAAGFLLGLFEGTVGRLFRRRRHNKSPLDLLHRGEFEPYFMGRGIIRFGQPVIGRWFRVGVLNTSDETIDGVRVELVATDPPGIYPPLPVVLHLKGDDPPPGGMWAASFSVRPCGRKRAPAEYVDVVCQAPSGDGQFQIVQINQAINSFFQAQPCRLRLRVSAPQHPSVEREFDLWLDGQNVLQFGAAAG